MRNNLFARRAPTLPVAGLCLVLLLAVLSTPPVLADSVARALDATNAPDAARIWTVVHIHTLFVTGFIVIACVILHYEAFIGLHWVLGRIHIHRRRRRLLLMMLSLIALHIVEIWIFAAGFYWLLLNPANGRIEGAESIYFLDQIYFSAVCYTTLGLGDLIPHGAIRFLTGTESLIGFLLITWSASFTFFEMERYWRSSG